MKNERLHWLLGEARDKRGRRRWTIERIADEVCMGRAHLSQVLGNKPGRGRNTRRRLVKFFKQEYVRTWPQILEALGWDAAGEVKPQTANLKLQGNVPVGTFHGEQKGEGVACG